MSVFLVSPIHIDAVLTAGLRLGPPAAPLTWFWSQDGTDIATRHYQLTPDTADRVGTMLYASNLASLNRSWEGEAPAYAFNALPGRPDPVQALKVVDCYSYECREAPGWARCEASEFCRAMVARMVAALPGYQDAEWLVDDRGIYTRTSRATAADQAANLIGLIERYGDAREEGRGAADILGEIEAIVSPKLDTYVSDSLN